MRMRKEKRVPQRGSVGIAMIRLEVWQAIYCRGIPIGWLTAADSSYQPHYCWV